MVIAIAFDPIIPGYPACRYVNEVDRKKYLKNSRHNFLLLFNCHHSTVQQHQHGGLVGLHDKFDELVLDVRQVDGSSVVPFGFYLLVYSHYQHDVVRLLGCTQRLKQLTLNPAFVHTALNFEVSLASIWHPCSYITLPCLLSSVIASKGVLMQP